MAYRNGGAPTIAVPQNYLLEMTRFTLAKSLIDNGALGTGACTEAGVYETRRHLPLRHRHSSSSKLIPLNMHPGYTLCSWTPHDPAVSLPQLFVFGGDREPRKDTLSQASSWDAPEMEIPSRFGSGKEQVLTLQPYPFPHLVCIGRLYYGRIHPAVIPLLRSNLIAVIGGCRNGVSVEYFDTDKRTSRVGEPLYEPRYAAGAVTLSDDPDADILVVGGLTGPWRGAALRSAERVSPSHDSKVTFASNARHSLITDAVFGQRYAGYSGAETARATVGGSLATYRDLCKPSKAYDSRHWRSTKVPPWPSLSQLDDSTIHKQRRLAPMRQARAFFAVTRLPGSHWVLVVGGHNGLRGLASSELYNIKKDFWVPGPQLTAPRVNPLVYVLNDSQVVVFGGVNPSNNNPVMTVEVWDPQPFRQGCLPEGVCYEKSFRVAGFTTSPLCAGAATVIRVADQDKQTTVPPRPPQCHPSGPCKIPKLRLRDKTMCPLYQTSIGSTATGGSCSMDISPTTTPRLRLQPHSFEAPRNQIGAYFKSRLVQKMRRRNSLKSFL